MFFTLAIVFLCTSSVINGLPATADVNSGNVSSFSGEKSLPSVPQVSLADEIEKFLIDAAAVTVEPVKGDDAGVGDDSDSAADQVHFDELDTQDFEEKAQFPDRCPCARNPMYDFASDPVRPNIGGSNGLAGPILWQISSVAENFIANMIGSIANGLLSGLGFNGYLNGGGRVSSRPAQDSVFDSLVGRGAFGQVHGSFGTPNPQSSSNTVDKLKQIINTFIHSNFGARFITVLHNFVTHNTQESRLNN